MSPSDWSVSISFSLSLSLPLYLFIISMAGMSIVYYAMALSTAGMVQHAVDGTTLPRILQSEWLSSLYAYPIESVLHLDVRIHVFG